MRRADWSVILRSDWCKANWYASRTRSAVSRDLVTPPKHYKKTSQVFLYLTSESASVNIVAIVVAGRCYLGYWPKSSGAKALLSYCIDNCEVAAGFKVRPTSIALPFLAINKIAVLAFGVYTPWVKKTRHQTLGHNFTNYYPIFTFFSLADSVVNLQQTHV